MSGINHRLRLVTMNVQLMTNDAVANQTAVSTRANDIADNFLNNRWPDVICLNEIFDEEARAILKSKLSAEWPHLVEKFGPSRTLGHEDKYMVIGSILAGLKAGNPLLALPVNVAFAELMSKLEIPDDSGLMILSRFPIERNKFVSYTDYASTDSFADKGIAYVQIRRSPNCLYQILATHLQASYKTEDEYREIRASQMRQIESLISTDTTADFTTGDRTPTVVCGDLNIQGAGSPRQEWQDVFKNASIGPFFTNKMCDAWNEFIAPGINGLVDKGITNRNFEKNWESRLDYVLLKDPPVFSSYPPDARPFSVQRMFLVHPGLSDHIGVAAEMNIHNEHYCPREAKDMVGLSVGTSPHLLDNGGMIWLRFSGRGTWSFTVDEHSGYEIYLPDNMSKVWSPQYTTDLAQIPHANDAWRGHFESLKNRAFTYAIPVELFFVRLYRRKDDAGPIRIGFYRHLGTSAFDAITVSPQSEPIGLDWNMLATLSVNPPTEFWLRSLIRRAVSGAPHLSRFEVINPTNLPIKLAILLKPNLDSSIDELELISTSNADPNFQVSITREGEDVVFWRVSRVDINQQNFTMRWFSSMNYLSYDVTNPPVLACVDETGIDAAGGDEISVYIRPDQFGGPLYLLKNKLDVDSDEVITLPGPPGSLWRSPDTGYLQKLELTITEDETLGDDVFSTFIPPLNGQAKQAQHEITLKPGTGEYRLRVQINREPS